MLIFVCIIPFWFAQRIQENGVLNYILLNLAVIHPSQSLAGGVTAYYVECILFHFLLNRQQYGEVDKTLC
jgi:hypothetical protein